MKTDYSTRSYILTAPGSGKIAAALAAKCQQGEIGESLFRSGITQEAFCLFLCRFALYLFSPVPPVGDKPGRPAKTPEQAARSFLLVSGGNASAAQKALASCSIKWEQVDANGESILDEKTGEPLFEKDQMSVAAYWAKSGSTGAAPNLSDLD